jgi:hypothetical protein
VFWRESQKERDHSEDRHRWKYNIKMCLREKGWAGMDWIDLAQNTGQWRTLMNTVINLHVP